MSGDKPTTLLRSTESDVSPKSQPSREGYFAAKKSEGTPQGAPTARPAVNDLVRPVEGGETTEAGAAIRFIDTRKEIDNTSDASATDPNDTVSPGSSEPPSRKASFSSAVTFQRPRDNLPQGGTKPHTRQRIAAASPPRPPPNTRFDAHVGFDNVHSGESTERNPISFTLDERHSFYQRNPQSRTFMVGVDANDYSDHAVAWLLDKLVDDGDEIVCVRVIETQGQTRSSSKDYQSEGKDLMKHVQKMNLKNHAIKLVVEYAVGKLHDTFQHMIKIHQPSMLIVGTKGRSLEGVQGVILNRNSFSKYCLQYSPVPVVVVRPTEKREKKKAKRAKDPSRNSYLNILGGQPHEADSENSSIYEMEPGLTQEEEAHKVAVAMSLPAAYDPTIKPIDPQALLGRRSGHRRSQPSGLATSQSVALAATGRVPAEPEPELDDTKSPVITDGEESEYEEECEAVPGEQALKMEILHRMESNEGAALRDMKRKLSSNSIEEEEEEDDDGDSGGGAKTQHG